MKKTMSIMDKATIVFNKLAEKYKDISLEEDENYAKYLLLHKLNIFKPGLKMGVSPITLVKHDLDKFTKKEWFPYVEHFEGLRGIKGTNDPEEYGKWREVVEQHYKNNNHHYLKTGKKVPLENQMEALADWYSVTKSKNDIAGLDTPSFEDWWKRRRDRFPISKELKLHVDKELFG